VGRHVNKAGTVSRNVNRRSCQHFIKCDYSLLVAAERVRFKSDFSSAHWLHQVISIYELSPQNPLRREAFERVLRCAINSGVTAAVKLAATYPDVAGFPTYLKLGNRGWKKTATAILNDFKQHEFQRFYYVRQGD
jgi:hypothetical protein